MKLHCDVYPLVVARMQLGGEMVLLENLEKLDCFGEWLSNGLVVYSALSYNEKCISPPAGLLGSGIRLV